MQHLLKPFQGLRWKLTLSYSLVTVSALVVVQVIAAVVIWFGLTNRIIYPDVLITVAKSMIVPQVAPYLENKQPDVIGLESWLRMVDTPDGLKFQSPSYLGVDITLGDPDQDTLLMVLDENLDYIASVPEQDAETLKSLLDKSAAVLAAARAGDESAERISMITPDRMLTIAMPVTNMKGLPIGVIVLRTAFPPDISFFQVFLSIGQGIVVFVLAAGALGTIFGYFTARGITKRLSAVSQAATLWSKGDFSTQIQDRSGDELSQLATQLNRMAEQLQNLLRTKQELAALEERNRLARDLHDSVKQQVFATTMQLGAARALLDQDVDAAVGHLAEAEELSRNAQSELAAIIRELRPVTLQDRGLSQALEEYSADWSRISNIDVELKVSGDCLVPYAIEETLFRVAQEALSNAARHSQATKVELQLVCNDDEISLMVCDNGIGFDISAIGNNGVGLRSMYERMQELDGRLDLESKPGQGTYLIAQCDILKGELP